MFANFVSNSYNLYLKLYISLRNVFFIGIKHVNHLIHNYYNTNNNIIFKTIENIDQNAKYIENNKQKFLSLLDKPFLKLNSNINPIFYSKKYFEQVIKLENNNLEKEWNKRILFESTPRGNVIMYYNPYKLGFSYFADQYMPYDILNSVAMKYVTLYRCVEFFIDEHVLPESKKSSLMMLLQDEKIESKDEKIESKEKDFKKILKAAPFAKLKSYRLDLKTSDKKELEIQREQNKFINMGKIMNYSFLKVPEKKKVDLFASSKQDSNIVQGDVSYVVEEKTIHKEVFSYHDYKKMFLEQPK